MKNIKVSLLSLAMIATLSACSSTTPKSPEKPQVSIVKSEVPVYAQLTKGGDGKYHFTSFSFNNVKNSVHLNSLQHNYFTREVECQKGLLNDNSAICNDDIEFRGVTVDGGDVLKSTVGNAAVALFTGGIGIVGAGAHYTSVFDQDAFDDALQQALSEIDRDVLISDANSVYLNNKKQIQTANETLKTRKETIENSLSQRVKLTDNSGVYTGKPKVAAVIKRKVPALNTAVSWTKLDELKAKLKQQAADNIASAELKLSCEKDRAFNVDVENCEQKWGVNGPATLADIKYVIQSAKKYRLQPQPVLKDEHIEIEVSERGGVKIINKTDSFVTLSSISFYFGGEIETKKQVDLEIPPNGIDRSQTLGNYGIYNNDTIIREFQRKHFDVAKQVGLAVKYKIINTNLEKTLYDTESLKIRDIGGRVI